MTCAHHLPDEKLQGNADQRAFLQRLCDSGNKTSEVKIYVTIDFQAPIPYCM